MKGHVVYFSITNQKNYTNHYALACDTDIIRFTQKDKTFFDVPVFKNIDDSYDDNRRTENDVLMDYKDEEDKIGKMKDFWTIKVV